MTERLKKWKECKIKASCLWRRGKLDFCVNGQWLSGWIGFAVMLVLTNVEGFLKFRSSSHKFLGVLITSLTTLLKQPNMKNLSHKLRSIHPPQNYFWYHFSFTMCHYIVCVCWCLLTHINFRSFPLSCSSHFKIYDYNRRPFCLYLIFARKKNFSRLLRKDVDGEMNERKKIH